MPRGRHSGWKKPALVQSAQVAAMEVSVYD